MSSLDLSIVFELTGDTLIDVPFEEEVLIGSSDKCDFIIPNHGLLPQHCRIYAEEYSIFLKNLSSNPDVYFNGEPIAPNSSVEINNGTVQIMDLSFDILITSGGDSILRCSHCGADNGVNGFYCRKCGMPLPTEEIPKDTPKQVKKEAPVTKAKAEEEKAPEAPIVKPSKPTPSKAVVHPAPAPVPNRTPVRSSSPRPEPKMHVEPPKPRTETSPKPVAQPVKKALWEDPKVKIAIIAVVVLLLIIGIVSLVNKGKKNIEGSRETVSTSRATTTTTTEAEPIDLSEAEVDLEVVQVYSGEEITVPVTLTVDGEEISEDLYTCTYENNVSIGTATITIEAADDMAAGSTSVNFSIVTGDSLCDDSSNRLVVELVSRIYSSALGRNPSLPELTARVGALLNGELTGMDLAREIFFSSECNDRDMDNAEYISAIYTGLFNRQPDADGLSHNESLLNSGLSRVDLLEGMASNPGGEFDAICIASGVALN